MVAVKRIGIWQLCLGCCADSLEFHDRPGVGKRAQCIVNDSAMATAAFLCCAGSAHRIVWLRNCFCSTGARRYIAAAVANALELSTGVVRATVRGLVSASAGANNGDGFDAARHY